MIDLGLEFTVLWAWMRFLWRRDPLLCQALLVGALMLSLRQWYCSQQQRSEDQLRLRYRRLNERVNDLDPCCMMQTFGEVTDRLKVDAEGNPTLVSLLNVEPKGTYRRGVMIQDRSGVGLYALGAKLAADWAEGRVWQSFKVVVLLPIERIYLYSQERPRSIRDFLRIWNVFGNYDSNEVLVVLSGCSQGELRSYQADTEKETTLKQQWISLLSTCNVPYVVVSNAPDLPYVETRLTIPVSLKPCAMQVTHLRGREAEKQIYMSGDVVFEDAKNALEQTLFVAEDGDAIRTTPQWHHQINDFLSGRAFAHSDVRVEHEFPPLGPQALLKKIARDSGVDLEEAPSLPIPMISTPSEWFSAAMTRPVEGANMGLYLVAGKLYVRKLSNQYVSPIDGVDLDDPHSSSRLDTVISTDAVFTAILTRVIADERFDSASSDEVVALIKAEKNAYAKRMRSKVPKRVQTKLAALCKAISQKDPLNKRFNEMFSNARASQLSYHHIQAKTNEELVDVGSASQYTQAIRRALSGEHQDIPFGVFGLAANLISETNRYMPSFIVTRCLLDLIEHDGVGWHKFFASPDYAHDAETLEDALVEDIVHVLGGLHPMSHGNSYVQVASDQQPAHGVHWVDFQSQLILMRWLANVIEMDRTMNPHLTGRVVSDIPIDGAPLIRGSLLDFAHLKLAQVNPNAFDHFVRCLETFENMLVPAKSLGEQIPKVFSDIPDFHRSNPMPAFRKVPMRNHTTVPNVGGVTLYGRVSRMFVRQVSSGGEFWVENSGEPPDEMPAYENDIRSLLCALMIDPDFHELHSYLAWSYLYEVFPATKDVEYVHKALDEANIACEHLDGSSGDFHSTALFIRIRCLWALNQYDQFDRAVVHYFEVYHDTNDDDYWNVFALRAYARREREGDVPEVLIDYQQFLEHVTGPEDNPLYMEAKEYVARHRPRTASVVPRGESGFGGDFARNLRGAFR